MATRKSTPEITFPRKKRSKRLSGGSMEKVGIAGDELTEENAHKIYQAFSTLFRKKAKTVVQKQKNTEPFPVSTEDMPDSAVSLSAFRNDATLFYTDDFESAAVSDDQRKVVRDFLEDENFPKKSLKEVNPYLFKTPQNFVDHLPDAGTHLRRGTLSGKRTPGTSAPGSSQETQDFTP